MASNRTVPTRVAWLAAAVLPLSISAGAARAAVSSADGMWRFSDAMPAQVVASDPWVRPDFFVPALLDAQVLALVLEEAPMEFTPEAFENPLTIELPMPDGTFQKFEIWESPVMHPDLAAQLPDVRTYAGQGLDDPTATLRMDWTPQGFHAQVIAAEWSVAIDPYSRNDTEHYAVYVKQDLRARGLDGWMCLGVRDVAGRRGAAQQRLAAPSLATQSFLQTYRTAVAATGEYTDFHSTFNPPRAQDGQAAIVTAINRVTGIYERDHAVRLQLVANNLNIVYTSTVGDPYTNNNIDLMLGENQSNLDMVIGSSNYDIGHVFGTTGGGLAGLGVVCNVFFKAQGATGLGSPTGDLFFVDYVAHEMGHQFDADHSFNSGVCAAFRSSSAAYEPGSGSTIMSYAGICGADNLQFNSNDYFANISLDQIHAYTQSASGGCPANTANGNSIPVVNAGPNYTIPSRTPFILTASATDANNDTLTYCWEQRNVTNPASQSATGGQFPDLGNNPIIRSFPPVLSPSRIVPRLTDLLNNTTTIGETLPTTNRTLRFSCTVRDNRAGGGGVSSDITDLTVVAAAGPFQVTFPNGGNTLTGSINVTWNVAGTNANGINTANVRIELSTDGGITWPTVLLASTPNDGSQAVTLPAVSTSSARIRVMAVGNIFFDISNANFSITPGPVPQPFSLTSPALGALNVSLTPTLEWQPSNNATSYFVELDSDSTFAAPLLFSMSTGSTSASIPSGTLALGTQYFWRVTASNAIDSRASTPAFAAFNTVPPPPFCEGDANDDNAVSFPDINSVLQNWGALYTPGSAGPGDADNSGTVGFVDISIILVNWGNSCPS